MGPKRIFRQVIRGETKENYWRAAKPQFAGKQTKFKHNFWTKRTYLEFYQQRNFDENNTVLKCDVTNIYFSDIINFTVNSEKAYQNSHL